MPPISCTSKWRIFSVRLLPSRTTAKASGSSSSSVSPAAQALAEFVGLGAQRGVVERLELRLQRVDLLHDAPVLLQQAVVAAAENLR